MKQIILLILLTATLAGCSKSLSGTGGEVTGVRGRVIDEPTPFGMVLVKRGSVEMGAHQKDSLWDDIPEAKGVSVDAFWMDEKEVSNAMYRQFVYYVRDSITVSYTHLTLPTKA